MKNRLLFIFIITTIVMISNVNAQSNSTFPYKNPKLPTTERLKDLLQRMTLHEKVLQLQHIHDVNLGNIESQFKGFSYGCATNVSSGVSAKETAEVYLAIQKYAKEKTRLGIPVLTTTEALHGAIQDGCTIYPHAIALGSTFNPVLINQMTQTISQELKGMGVNQVLSPVLDIARDPRWGRVEETYGEDPFLNGTMGVAFIKGFHKNNIVCTPKHFVAHGTPTGGLNLSSVKGGIRELKGFYAIPFEMVIRDTNPMSIMNSYGSYDDEPVVSSHFLLTDFLRGELGFKGYVYSDWSSIEMQHFFLHTAIDRADAAKQALIAGVDLEAAGSCYLELEKLVNEKKLDVKYIDLAVSRVLFVKFSSGLFDIAYEQSENLNNVLHSKESIALAKTIADESIVLLKNANNILPLSKEKYKKIALIGPTANQVEFGDYSWANNNQFGVTPLKALQQLLGDSVTINYANGCDNWSQDKKGFNEALDVANKSDISIIVVGTHAAGFTRDKSFSTTGEGYDLSNLDLPGVQEDLIKAVKALNKPVIVVVVSGKPLTIPWIKENADAVVLQWYGGEQQGNTLAEVLYGKVNPSGKLNVSFPESIGKLPCYYNYLPNDKGFYKIPGTKEKPGRDYVFSDTKALWNFGFGLSYTKFEYLDTKLSKDILNEKETLTIEVTIKNTGAVQGKEVVQLYVRDKVSSVVTPIKQLKAFSKVLVMPNETVSVSLQLSMSDLFLYNKDMKRVVEKGEFELQIGSASDDIRITKKIRID